MNIPAKLNMILVDGEEINCKDRKVEIIIQPTRTIIRLDHIPIPVEHKVQEVVILLNTAPVIEPVEMTVAILI